MVSADSVGSALFRRWLRLYLPVIGFTISWMMIRHWTGIWVDFGERRSSWGEEFKTWYYSFKNYSFVFLTGENVEFTDNYNGHLWSIPIEFKGSIIVYTVISALSRCTRNARLWCEVALIFYFLYVVDGWYGALFMGGMLLCDLDLLALDDEEPRFLAKLEGFKEFIFFHLFLIAMYLGGVPSCESPDGNRDLLASSPGWRWLYKLRPQAVWDVKWFYLTWAAILTVASIPRLPWLKRFFETRFCQYLGRVSFALYLVHGIVIYVLADRLYAAVGFQKNGHKNIPQWVGIFPMAMNGPMGFELAFWAVQLINLPITLYVAEMVTKLFDEPSQDQGLPEPESSHEGDGPGLDPFLKSPPTSDIPPSKDVPNLPASGDIPPPTTESSSTPPPLIDIDFQKDLNIDLPVNTLNSLSGYKPRNYIPDGENSYAYATFMASRNPSIEDPYYLAIHSLIYRILWSPRSKTSKHPFIVFVGDFVSPAQRRLLTGAGALVRELAPLPWNPPDPDVPGRWKDLFAKLHMWNETEFSRILFLDADAFPVAPIDDMFEAKKVWNCIKSKMQLDDFLPGGEPVCEPYIFAGVPADPYSIFDANINVGSMVFTPNSKQHQRLLQNYLKFDKYDVKMAEQAFLNWQFGINSAYPPGMLEREYGAFFPNDEEHARLKVVHEKIWAAERGWMKEEWEGTWREMLGFYGSEEFKELRKQDGEVGNL
ncbi:hypothetical protein N0V95_002428 [Ascochyta clinopodiicola]|nr:hypothetical protein N0V95_002428 [Ascochyta clinopodiicola]